MKNPITSYPTTPYNINCSSWTPEFTLGFLWGSCLSLSLDFCVILVFCLTFWSFSCGHCIIFTHIYCFWLPLRYLLSFFMWSLYYFYSHLLLLIITPSVPFVLFHVVIVLFLLTFTASDYYPFGTFCPFSCGHCIIFTHIYCFWLPLRYLLSFFMWSLYYFYSHLLLLITPSVPFVLFHVVIVLFLLTFTASDYAFGTFCPFSCGHCIIFTHIYCFWLPLRYPLSFFMWSLYYFYSHLLLLITPSVPFVLFHVVIVLFLLTFTASDYYPFGIFNHCTYMWTALALSHHFTKRRGP